MPPRNFRCRPNRENGRGKLSLDFPSGGGGLLGHRHRRSKRPILNVGLLSALLQFLPQILGLKTIFPSAGLEPLKPFAANSFPVELALRVLVGNV